MIKKTVVAIAVSALACGAWASSAAAAKHHAKHAAPAPAAKAETIPGVNAMTNAPAIPAVEHPAPYSRLPGVNPM
jgi:hypothetical protein